MASFMDDPRVTNITCHGANDLLVEWRRPEITFDSVKFYRIYLNSIDGKKKMNFEIAYLNEDLYNKLEMKVRKKFNEEVDKLEKSFRRIMDQLEIQH